MRISPVVLWVLGCLAAVGAVVSLARGQWVGGVTFACSALAMGWLLFTQRGPRPHTPWSPSLVVPGRAVVFWKDGCPYCHRLLRAIGPDERVSWVNIYRDRAGDAEVRRLNGGDQLTPTAVVGQRVLKNPSADELLAALG